jgi:stearoyl-CoA desaturase (delta-9 desaturase)
MYLFGCFVVFACAYLLTILITSVGYHRALAHGAVSLHPLARRALLTFGPWLTGFDPKIWAVMHRMHHVHSDTPDDPHSPVNVGFFGIFRAQFDGYVRTETGLKNDDPAFTGYGRDLEMGWPNRTGRWYLPYLLHVVVAIVVGVAFGWGVGAALFAGTMSHVVQGAIINYFGHAWGGRNYASDDNSRNNHMAAWLVLGEGFQNNHHRWPSSARFSCRGREVDLGYGACRLLQSLGVLRVVERTLAPRLSRGTLFPIAMPKLLPLPLVAPAPVVTAS